MDEQKAIEIFQKVVDLSVAGALGKSSASCAVNPEDWPAVAHIAMKQSVLPIVGCTLLNSPELKCPDQIKNQLMEHTRMIAAQNQIKQQRIMGLICGMEEAGIQVRLIKGYAIADCYARPECRKSEDTDLLILPEQEEAAYEYFRKQGFRVDRRNATSHHAVCQHPKMGMVELHVQLYDELIQDGWFDLTGVGLLPQEADVEITSDHGSYNTLGYTDHALFLAIHMVKHFIGIGMNIRMMLDVALYLSKYKHLIDFERFWSVLKQIHFDCVVNCVLTIAIRTGLLVWGDFPGACEVDSEKAEMFLYDLSSAVFSPRRTQSENAYYEYSKYIMQKKMGQNKYRLYMLKWVVRNTLSQIWPDTDQLYAQYQVPKDKRWMLPVLRIRRLFDLPIQKIKDGITPQRLLTDESKEQESIGKRLELFKQLDML